MAMVLALFCSMAGCRTPTNPSFGLDSPTSALSKVDADVADALANFAIGIVRDSMADAGALANYERAMQLCPDRLELALRVAATHLRLGQTDAAMAVLQDACLRNPDAVEPRMFLAQLCQTLKQWDAAREAWRGAIRVAPANAMSYLQLALMDCELNDDAAALALLEDALPKVDDPRPLLRLLGDLYVQKAGEITAGHLTPDLQKAIGYYQRASCLPIDDLTLPYLIQLGDLYLLTRQFEKAIDCFNTVIASEPDNFQVHKKLVLCYLAQGKQEKSIRHLKTIADNEPQNAEVQYYLGELYEKFSDTTHAIAQFTAACKGAAPSAKMFLKLAFFYVQSDPTKASEVLEAGLARMPEDSQLLDMLAKIYLASRQDDKAKRILKRLQDIVSRNPDRAHAARRLMFYGAVAQQFTLRDSAAALYLKSLELDPTLVDAYSRLAWLYASHNRKGQALRVMEQADRVIPDNVTVNYALGMLLSSLQRYPEAMEALGRTWDAALSDPEQTAQLDSAFFFSFGSVCERAGQLDQAEALLHHAIRLDPENSEAFNYLAYMWAERGVHLDQALECVRHALDEEPDNGAFLDTLGWIYFKQGRFQEALDEVGHALVLMPDDPTIMEHLGDILMVLRRDEEGLYWWKKSYRRDPGNAVLGEKLKARGVNLDTLQRSVPLPSTD